MEKNPSVCPVKDGLKLCANFVRMYSTLCVKGGHRLKLYVKKIHLKTKEICRSKGAKLTRLERIERPRKIQQNLLKKGWPGWGE